MKLNNTHKFDFELLSDQQSISISTNAIKRILYDFNVDLSEIAKKIVDEISLWLKADIESVDVFKLYDFIVPIIDEEPNSNNSEENLAAHHALLYYLYYVIWELFPEEKFDLMPSDILEVDKLYFFECLNKAISASKNQEEEFNLQKIEIEKFINS